MVYRLEAIPFPSRSLIACWYSSFSDLHSSFSDLHFVALERHSMELWGMVSSMMRVTSSSPTSTMSGWVEVTKVFSGMVDLGYHLLAHRKICRQCFIAIEVLLAASYQS